MSERDLYEVHDLLTDNLAEDHLTESDVRMWFRAFRRLASEYDALEVIRRFRALSLRESESSEAHYYLYVVHWMQWYRRETQDRDKALEYMAEAKRRTKPLARTRSFEWLGDVTERPWCPLVHESELGGWDHRLRFHREPTVLAYALGTIERIDSPQAGEIRMWPLDDPDGHASRSGTFKVFFVPGTKFVAPRDEGEMVRFNLGFSAEGLRAWRLERVSPSETDK